MIYNKRKDLIEEGGVNVAKIMKRCQVCDGPVVSGRCKLCGMPYRNDEERYHLNENRRDHYAHAPQSVKNKMEAESRSFRQRLAPKVEGPAAAGRRSPRNPAGTRPAASQPANGGNSQEKKKNSSGILIYAFILCVGGLLMTKGCL